MFPFGTRQKQDKAGGYDAQETGQDKTRHGNRCGHGLQKICAKSKNKPHRQHGNHQRGNHSQKERCAWCVAAGYVGGQRPYQIIGVHFTCLSLRTANLLSAR